MIQRMSRLLFDLFLTTLFATSLLHAQHESLSALRIEAFTWRGERIDNIHVSVEPLSASGSYKGEGRNVSLSVPTGTYMLRVQSPGFRTTEQLLRVYGPSVLTTVVLPVAPLHGQTTPTLSGQVFAFPGDPAKLRVRLVPLFGGWVEEVHPDENGRFRFWPDPGPYILMTVIDGQSMTTVT